MRTLTENGGDADRVVVAVVIAVALSAILFASLDVYSYYQSFRLPTLTLLNSSGLAENYPSQVFNGTTVTFKLQVLNAQSHKTYGVLVYVSNGTGYTAERNAPMGLEVAALSFPQGEDNLSMTVNFSLFFTVVGGVVNVKTVTLNNYTKSVSLELPYNVIGLFFQLYIDEDGVKKTVPYAWTSLWLDVEVSR